MGFGWSFDRYDVAIEGGYKGQSVNVGKIGRELGVAYLVEGSPP